MTLIVGIRCKDNAVIIGTDSAMTFGVSPAINTIKQPYNEKIEIIDDRIIVAGTGSVGLGQRFVNIVQKELEERILREIGVIEIGCFLCEWAVKNFASTGVKQGSHGALVAIPCKGKAELIEFGLADFQPEVKTDANWYVSMGSGQAVADPLLGFVRAIFWGDTPPNRQDGIFAAFMVLKLACDMATFGVALPFHIAVLAPDPNNKGQFFAKKMTQEELLEHEQNFAQATKHFKNYPSALHAANKQASTLPEPPKIS